MSIQLQQMVKALERRMAAVEERIKALETAEQASDCGPPTDYISSAKIAEIMAEHVAERHTPGRKRAG